MPTIPTGFAGTASFTGMPAVISQLLQGGFLVREMEEGLDSILAYRRLALQETFPGRIGESMTRTRKGRLTPIATPMQTYSGGATSNLLDNGLSVSTWSMEQYTFVLSEYAATQDLNLVAEQAQIADQFIANARNNGVQAAQSLERICRLKLFGAYMSGNTRGIVQPAAGVVTGTTANSTGAITAGSDAYINVDDIRGFQFTLVNGQLTAISVNAPLAVTLVESTGAVLTGFNVLGSAAYVGFGVTNPTLNAQNVGVYVTGAGPATLSSTPDAIAQNVGNTAYVAPSSSNPISPTNPTPGLVWIRNATGSTITLLDAAATPGRALITSDSPQVFRPSGRVTTAGLTGADVLSWAIIEDAVAYLRDNGVPPMDDGSYHAILDNTGLRQLFADQDFKVLFAGRSQSPEWREGDIIRLLGVTLVPTTESYVQVPAAVPSTSKDSGFTAGGPKIRRCIIAGSEALIQGNFEGMETWLNALGFDRADSNIAMVDGVVQIVREPLDRLQQIVSMSWTWIGDYAVPTDITSTPAIIPTASGARYKRCSVVEFAG